MGDMTNTAERVVLNHLNAMIQELKDLGDNVEIMYNEDDEEELGAFNGDTAFREVFMMFVEETLYDLI